MRCLAIVWFLSTDVSGPDKRGSGRVLTHGLLNMVGEVEVAERGGPAGWLAVGRTLAVVQAVGCGRGRNWAETDALPPCSPLVGGLRQTRYVIHRAAGLPRLWLRSSSRSLAVWRSGVWSRGSLLRQASKLLDPPTSPLGIGHGLSPPLRSNQLCVSSSTRHPRESAVSDTRAVALSGARATLCPGKPPY